MSKMLWARVGMSCELSEAEYVQLKKLMKENHEAASNMLSTLFEKRGEYNGEAYLVADCDDNPNIDDDFDF